MAKLLLQLSAFLLAVTFINGLPVDDSPASGQFVIDIPAGKGSESQEDVRQEATKFELPAPVRVEESAEVIPVNSQSSSEETDDGSHISSISDLFNIRIPFSPLFVYRRPVIRDPFDSQFHSSFQPFSTVQREPQLPQAQGYDVMSQMEAMMKRMQQQMTSLWSVLTPQYRPRPHIFQRPIFSYDFDRENDTDTSSADVINVDNLPSNYSNSTSETKVIDGQLVEVNKTIHKVSSNDSSSFFQVQVIKIRPQATKKPEVLVGAEESQVNSEIHQENLGSGFQVSQSNVVPSAVAPTAESKPTATTMKAEDPKMNEIDENPEQRRESSGLEAEPFPYLLNRFRGQYDVDSGENQKPSDGGFGTEPAYEIVPLQQRRMERMSNSGGADLSDDIRVNRILDEQNRKAQIKMVHPDVELIDI